MCCFDGTSVEGNRILFCDGCNAALHQVCYGVHTIPEGDFYCDRCQYITLLAGESSSFDYYHAKTAVMCCLCPLQHGGLKPTTDGRWVHLCCALWSPDSVIVDLSEMSPINISRVPVQLPVDSEAYAGTSSYSSNNNSYGRAGRAISGGADDANTELFRQNCLLTPLKEACMFCNLHGGRVQQCCYIDPAVSGHNSKCTKVFHPLCAWFEGVYMSSTIDDPTFQGVTRNAQFPSGLTFCFLCDAHTATARPNPTTRTEQQKLRVKYRINVDDLEQIPGARRRKKPKKQKQSNNMSLGRVGGGGGAETKDLNVDVYDSNMCACCMQSLSSDVFMCGMVAEGVPQWEIEEGVAEMSLLPTVTPGESASTSTVAESSSSEPLLSGTQEGPTSTGNAPESQQNSQSMDVVVDSQAGTQIEAAGTVMPTPSQPSLVPSDNTSYNTNVNTVPFAATSFGQDSSVSVETVQVGPHLTLTQVTDNVSSSDNLVTLPLMAPVTGLLGDAVPTTAIAAAAGADTTVAATPVVPSNAYKCTGCNLHIHKLCLVGSIPLDDADFTCDVCVLQQLTSTESASPAVDVRCVLCPRRGGYLKRTTDFKWAHVYCASTVPGQMRIVDHKIDVRTASSKKEKCVICNRKQGVCVQCSHVGCTTQFHPLCAARSGKGVIRTRMGEKAAYCFAHLPEGVERLGNGHWVDGFEIERLRYGLERARLILDVLCKREKYKKMLCKAETELLSIRFHKTLDRAKKRKHNAHGDEVDLSDMSLYSSESEYASDSDLDQDGLGASSNKLGAATSGEFVPLEETLGPAASRGEGMTVTVSTGEEVPISATWMKRKEVRLPKRLITTFSGIDVDRKDVQREANARSFLKHYRDALQKNTNAFRTATQLFTSATEEAEFGRTVGTKLKKHMVLPMDEFRAAVKGSTWLKLDGPIKPKATANVGRPKKGYAFVEVEEEGGDDMQIVDSVDEEFKIRRTSHYKKGNTASAASSTVKPKFRSNSDLEGSVSAGETPNTGRRPRGRPPRQQQGIDAWLNTKASTASAAAALAGAADDWEDLNSAQSTPQVPTTGRKKSKKQMQIDAEAAEVAALALAQAQATEAFNNSKSNKRGRRGEEEPVSAPTTAKKLTKKEQAAADALAAQQEEEERAAQELANSKRIKKNKRALEEDIEASAVEVVDSRTKRQRLREEAVASTSADPKYATNPNGTTVMDASNTLVYVKQKEDSKKFSAATLYILERRLKDILVDILTHEVPEDSVAAESAPSAATNTSKSKSKSKKAQATVETRRIAEDFEAVPYDAIPDYDTLVSRLVTLDSMEEKLNAHEYRSMQEFCEDFFVLLNNARSITTPDSIVSLTRYLSLYLTVAAFIYDLTDRSSVLLCLDLSFHLLFLYQTWADSALLAELFETSKTNSTTSSTAARPRAEGKEIICTKLNNSNNASSIGGTGSAASSPRSQRAERAAERGGGNSATAAAPAGNSSKAGSDGKMRWTCACCNTSVSQTNISVISSCFSFASYHMSHLSSSFPLVCGE